MSTDFCTVVTPSSFSCWRKLVLQAAPVSNRFRVPVFKMEWLTQFCILFPMKVFLLGLQPGLCYSGTTHTWGWGAFTNNQCFFKLLRCYGAPLSHDRLRIHFSRSQVFTPQLGFKTRVLLLAIRLPEEWVVTSSQLTQVGTIPVGLRLRTWTK